MSDQEQRNVCAKQGAGFFPPLMGSRVGIALHTLELRPLNGMRVEPEGNACGWYLWGGGEPSDADDFFAPMCVEHLATHCPDAVPFLALPPGWRFLTDGNYVDIWYDVALLRDEQRKA
jgi:hypothetical protein